MTTLYKLTSQKGTTRNDTQWGPGVSHSGTGEGEMCGPGWIHAYRDPLLAVFLNPAHGNFSDPRLWKAEGEVSKDDGAKVGCRTLTTLEEMELPVVSRTQRIAFAILAATAVFGGKSAKWDLWAADWLSGKDRNAAAANAAYAAANAAYAPSAAAAAYANAYAAANAAYAAANAAANAAYAAANAKIDLVALAHKALNEFKE